MVLLHNPIASMERCKLIEALLEHRQFLPTFKRPIVKDHPKSAYAYFRFQQVPRHVYNYGAIFGRFIKQYTFPKKLPFVNFELLLRYCPSPLIYDSICELIDEILQEQPSDKDQLTCMALLRRGYEILEIVIDVLNIKTAAEYRCLLRSAKFSSLPRRYWDNIEFNGDGLAVQLAQSSVEEVMQLLACSRHITASQGQLKEIRQCLDTVSDVAVHKVELKKIYETLKMRIQSKMNAVAKKKSRGCIVM